MLGCFGALLSVVATGWEPVNRLDRHVAHGLNEVVAERHDVVASTQMVTDLGGGMTWWLVLSAATLALLLARHPRAALFVAVTGAGGELLNRAVKAAVGRPRPELAEPVSQAGGYAFPSGHAMGSAIGVGVLLLVLLPRLPLRWRRPALAASVLFAAAVGASRVVLGVHWASDVLAGWLLAAAWLLTTAALLRPWPQPPAAPQRPAQDDAAGRTDDVAGHTSQRQ